MSRAPGFTSRTQHGAEISLVGLLAEAPVLLVFFPFSFTGTCTGELRRLDELQPEFLAHGVRPMAISCDSMFTQRVFAEQQGASLWLLTDFWPHGEIAQAYQVFDNEQGCAIRGSFLIDRDQQIVWSVRNPIGQARDLDEHLDQARRLTR